MPGLRLGPSLGARERQLIDFSFHTLISSGSLFSSLPSSLKINKILKKKKIEKDKLVTDEKGSILGPGTSQISGTCLGGYSVDLMSSGIITFRWVELGH